MTCIGCNRRMAGPYDDFCTECRVTFRPYILDRVRRFAALKKATHARVVSGHMAGRSGRILSVGTPFTVLDVGFYAPEYIDNMELEPWDGSP